MGQNASHIYLLYSKKYQRYKSDMVAFNIKNKSAVSYRIN